MSAPNWLAGAAAVSAETFKPKRTLQVTRRHHEKDRRVVASYDFGAPSEYHQTLCRMPAILDIRVRAAVNGRLGAGVIGLALWALETLEDQGKRLVVEKASARSAHAFKLTIEKRTGAEEVVQILIPGGRSAAPKARGCIGIYVPHAELAHLRKKILGPYTVGIAALCEYALDQLDYETAQIIVK
jgi:hypothetical protein